MSAQGKLLLYILMICLIFYLVQDRFNLFDIQFLSNSNTEQEESSQSTEEETESTFKLDTGTLNIVRSDNAVVSVEIEVADTEEERAQGLMYRDELGEYSGMLFIFDTETNNSFWMKNTKIPLDLIFIDSDKQIVDVIKDAQPCVEGHICPALRPQFEYMYCLEVNSGFAEENRITVGDTAGWILE
mgnify:FL=1|jgi:uncharacterized membrane protein (UPF0127 family)